MASVSVCFDCVSQICVWIGTTPRSWPDRITSFFRPFRRPRLLPWLCLLSATRAICGDGSHRCASNIDSIFLTDKTFCCKGGSWTTSPVIHLICPLTECPRRENDRASQLTRFVWRGREISSARH